MSSGGARLRGWVDWRAGFEKIKVVYSKGDAEFCVYIRCHLNVWHSTSWEGWLKDLRVKTVGS